MHKPRLPHTPTSGFLRLALASLSTAALVACTPAGTMAPKEELTRAPAQIDLPPMKRFASLPLANTQRSNTDIARDFLDLSFQLENGTLLETFTRFEGPITLRVKGDVIPTSLGPDLEQLLERLRREAGIDITRVGPNTPASITIHTLEKAELNRTAPNTACIVAPNVSSWTQFKNARRKSVSWTTVSTRKTLAIFLPSNEAPQEIRDCLHEELAQALGPLNDLYRLSDSVFNDDNFHSVLTEFDMLILRATYAPELKSGMNIMQVSQELPQILRRIHPAGEDISPLSQKPTPRSWIEDVITATGAQSSTPQRIRAAERAVAQAREEGWEDTRTGFAHSLLGRLTMSYDLQYAQDNLERAYEIYAQNPSTQYHAAHTALPLATLALAGQDYEAVLELTTQAQPAAQASGNAVLLASLMLTNAEALLALGRASEARAVRLDSLGWARYGFGTDSLVRRRATEIAALARH